MIFFDKYTVSNYAKITKVSTDTSLREIQDLMGKGIIEQGGSVRSTSYKLITILPFVL